MKRIRLNFHLSNDERQFLSFFETPKLRFKLTTEREWLRICDKLEILFLSNLFCFVLLLFLFCTLAVIAFGIELPLETSTSLWKAFEKESQVKPLA